MVQQFASVQLLMLSSRAQLEPREQRGESKRGICSIGAMLQRRKPDLQIPRSFSPRYPRGSEGLGMTRVRFSDGCRVDALTTYTCSRASPNVTLTSPFFFPR